ncbi:MAG: nucleotidyl transferase AbiEii/AbiGii toxin family protein [Candidatus Omnitrophica bacterium]|nr:nucleotidyl transferase AbiEii/AbiGii toxin family protein [Candidatus Omnitrophota bacterium]
MLEVIRQYTAGERDAEARLNKAREFLQVLALKTLYDQKHFSRLVFTGGTALRILFDLRRFSEDLDFSCPSGGSFEQGPWIRDLVKGYSGRGLPVDAVPSVGEDRAVKSVMLKFKGLHKVLGIPAPADQKLSIKLEVDTNPPEGGQVAQTLLNRTFLFTVAHFDLPSLFATKLHAVLFRKYTKGRDIYDLIWYLSRKVRPNLLLLNNAIAQTDPGSPSLEEGELKERLTARLDGMDLVLARKDVERFVLDKAELDLFDRDILRRAVEAYGWTVDNQEGHRS